MASIQSLLPPICYYISLAESDKYLVEREENLVVTSGTDKATTKSQFKLQYNDDNTISLFSIMLQKYLSFGQNFDRKLNFKAENGGRVRNGGRVLLRSSNYQHYYRPRV